MVQLERAQGHGRGARNKYFDHATRRRLLECVRHIGSRAGSERHSRIAEDRSSGSKPGKYLTSNLKECAAECFPFGKSVEWWCSRRRRSAREDTWQSVAAPSNSRPR